METNYRNSLEEDRIFRVYNDNTYKSLNNLNLLKSDLIGSNEVSNDNHNTNKELEIVERLTDLKDPNDITNVNNRLQNSYNTVNTNVLSKNLNQDLNNNLLELNDLESNDIKNNNKKLEYISHTIASKQRLINEINTDSKKQNKIFSSIVWFFFFLGLAAIIVILKLTGTLDHTMFLVSIIVIIVLYLLILAYKFNFLYFRKVFNLRKTEEVIKELNKDLNNSLDKLTRDIQDDVQGNYKDWKKNNCKCPPKNINPKIIHVETEDEEGVDSGLIHPATFYYDGSAPKQILYPKPNSPLVQEQNDQIFHQDYSVAIDPENNILNTTVKQKPFDNSILRQNYNYNNNKNMPYDVSKWYVGDVTRTANL